MQPIKFKRSNKYELFTNEEKNDKIKKEEYLTADKGNSSTPTGISRFLYQTPEKQKNTVSQNFSYNPQKPQSIKTISADRTANSLNKNTFKQPVNSFNNVKPPKSIKAEDITEDLEKERIFKATKRIAKNLPEDKLNEVYKLKEKRPDDYYNLTDNSREDYKRMKDLFSPRVQFSVSNYENNYDMMNKDEKIMLTSNAQNYFNKLGYTDKNGNYLEEDGIWGPKTQKVFERYKKDTGYVSPKNNNVDKAYTAAKDLKEDIYNPETLIASPENLRSDVSLYGKSPADMNKKYSYENGELKVTMDNDYPLIAKANSLLSKSSRELNDYFEKELKNNNPIDAKEYQDILNKYVSKTDLRKDTSQYAIFKLLRALNNNYYNPSPKNSEVVEFIASTLNKISEPSVTNEAMRKSFNKAMNYTKNNADYNETVKAWFDVFVKYSEIEEKYQAIRSASVDKTGMTSNFLDSGINQIIDSFNSGKDYAIVYKQTPTAVLDGVYSTETGWDKIIPVTEIEFSTSMDSQEQIIDKKYK